MQKPQPHDNIPVKHGVLGNSLQIKDLCSQEAE